MRRRFLRRMAFFAFLAFLIFSLFIASLVTLLITVFDNARSGNLGILIPVALVFILILVSTVARGIRRIVVPLGDLVDAAEKIEAGDYSARVKSRGPRELRALSRAFNEMSERLERSEAERTRLLADVTHELRTPLTVMQGNIEALIDGLHQPDEARFRSLLEDTRVLSRLIDDLRTVSLADAGALALHREPTDVGELIRDTVASFGTQADAAGVALRADLDGHVNASIDPVRIREVLTNVVANALRYTPRDGSVTVGMRPRDEVIEVRVRDTGSGVAPDVLPHMFDRFTHADDSPGAGLGLAIAKGLVAAHGGEIDATSTLGQGTEVRFTIPRAEKTPPD
ncbi:MAG: HAMP domain-containing histidine kinase [Chloroflexota bacterium]|nr:HAMP domain-containing histidine kinase [Chloroflexota bacterium]